LFGHFCSCLIIIFFVISESKAVLLLSESGEPAYFQGKQEVSCCLKWVIQFSTKAFRGKGVDYVSKQFSESEKSNIVSFMLYYIKIGLSIVAS
jgi:hypothetical protein